MWIDSPDGRLCCKLIAVHAGLEKSKKVDAQMEQLRAKDTSQPKVAALSGRQNVWEIPKVVFVFRCFSEMVDHMGIATHTDNKPSCLFIYLFIYLSLHGNDTMHSGLLLSHARKFDFRN